MARIKRKITKKEVSKVENKDREDILDLAKRLREECINRKCDCPFFDGENLECKLAKPHLSQPLNWEV